MEAKFSSGAVSLITDLIEKAVSLSASDIHFEPTGNNIRVRYRIDGILQNGIHVHKSMQQQIISRIKVMADLDISEQRLPQDGKAFIKILNRDFDLRVSMLPTVHGEKAVIRILDRNSTTLPIESLGMLEKDMMLFKEIIGKPQGLVIVCGPTGCGKTTTLYAALEKINKDSINIITIEDPIEYQLPGINQIQVNNKTGLTFAKGLRGILRQDPDVIMVGEIRDRETAAISIQAAMTGHLVFSTLHTNDAASAAVRLIDMGIEPFLISSTLKCVISQRLVRRICTVCKGKGCRECNMSGFKGRIGVFELLKIDGPVKDCINNKSASQAIAKTAKMNIMADNADVLIKNNITSREEVLANIYLD